MIRSYGPSLADQGYDPEDVEPPKRCPDCEHGWGRHRKKDGTCAVRACDCGMTQCPGCGMWVVLAGNLQGVCPNYPGCRAEVDAWFLQTAMEQDT